jgi:hypothetical protein
MNDLGNIFDDIKTFLPKYLSEEDSKRLFDELKDFPKNIDKRFYTTYLDNQDIIFQGDGLKDFTVINLPNEKFYKSPITVFSNTCDTDEENSRLFPSQLVYAPIFSLKSYQSKILAEGLKDEKSINNHIEDIKKQKITQMLYLPKGAKLPEDCIVFLDRVLHCDNKSVPRKEISKQKIFVLSNYGFYLFLIKLSIHFTRIQEKVDRK